jgi:hypothetical protein
MLIRYKYIFIQIGMEQIDDKRLIDVISNFIMNNYRDNLKITDESYSTPESVWGRICLNYNGKYDKSVALTIKTKYTKNHHKLRTRVDDNLRNLNTLNGNNAGILNEIKLEISSDEWNPLKNQITGQKGKKFLAGFTYFLSKRLKLENEIRCYLKCSYNWFKKDNREEASKILFETLSVGEKIPGLIHEIVQNPFGLLMISEIQVKMSAKFNLFQIFFQFEFESLLSPYFHLILDFLLIILR